MVQRRFCNMGKENVKSADERRCIERLTAIIYQCKSVDKLINAVNNDVDNNAKIRIR